MHAARRAIDAESIGRRAYTVSGTLKVAEENLGKAQVLVKAAEKTYGDQRYNALFSSVMAWRAYDAAIKGSGFSQEKESAIQALDDAIKQLLAAQSSNLHRVDIRRCAQVIGNQYYIAEFGVEIAVDEKVQYHKPSPGEGQVAEAIACEKYFRSVITHCEEKEFATMRMSLRGEMVVNKAEALAVDNYRKDGKPC